MKVYLVTYDEYKLQILKVFATKEAAEKYINSFHISSVWHCNIVEMELEQ